MVDDVMLTLCRAMYYMHIIIFTFKVLSRQLALSQQTVGAINTQLERHQEDARGAVAALNVLAESYTLLQTTLNQALTRLAAYEDRVRMQARRLAAVKGTVLMSCDLWVMSCDLWMMSCDLYGG